MPDRTDFLKVVVGQNGLPDLKTLLLSVAFKIEDVGARPDEGHEAHDQFLADRVDRRIGYLCEILLEIGIEELRLRRQCRNRRVGAHRPDRFLAGHRHRRQQKQKIFLAVAERLLAIQERHIRARRTWMDREIHILEHDLGALQPFGIRMRGGERAFDFVVRDDPALFQIDEQHPAGLQPPFGNDPLFGDRQDADFRGQHDEPVAGDDIARRTQAIAVEHRADLAAIGKGDGGRSVPGLHHRGVIFVEGAARRVHQRIARPGLRNEHHHRMAKRIAALDEEFERIVETGRVRLAFVGDRPELAYVIAEKPGGNRGLPRRHPIEVAAQGIDFAIMPDETIGMRQRPGRKRVGRKALMDKRKRQFEQGVGEVLEIFAELRREQEAFVDDGARRKRHRIEAGDARVVQMVDRVRNRLAQNKKPSLEHGLVLDMGPRWIKIWRLTGSAALTLSPRQDESTGVSRQPRVICPSAATIFSTMSSTIRRPSISRGKNSAPMAYSPGAGRTKPSSVAFLAKKRCGI